MNDVVAALTRILFRAVVLAMGLIVFVSLLAAALVVAVLWGLRALWAKLTGQPVVPWAWRIDPRTGFGRGGGAAFGWPPRGAAPAAPDGEPIAPEGAPSRRAGTLPRAADVTDVEPRELP